jgi:hypothetical protein
MPQSGLLLSAVVAVRVVLSTTYLNILTGSMDSLPRGALLWIYRQNLRDGEVRI